MKEGMETPGLDGRIGKRVHSAIRDSMLAPAEFDKAADVAREGIGRDATLAGRFSGHEIDCGQ